MALKSGLQNNHLRACQYHTFLGLVPRDQVSVVGDGPRDLFLSCSCLLGFFKFYFIYLFLVVLGLCCRLGFSLLAIPRLLTAIASPVVDHRL